jgi:hypothetical protein
MGCVAAGAAVLLIPWPVEQRLLVVGVGVGLTVALQGVWEIVRHLQGHRPEPAQEQAALDSNLTRRFAQEQAALDYNLPRWFYWLMFGRVDYVQIVSPALDQKVRARHQAATAELARLGFGYFCSYGEAFSAFRLLLLFPVIVILAMLWKREVVRLRQGTKIQTCHPLWTAGDNSTYADVSALGVKFYTAFTEGPFLVSANDESDNSEGPVMTKRCHVASASAIWAEHRSAIEAFEASGRRVDRRIDFRTFADMSRRETAPR